MELLGVLLTAPVMFVVALAYCAVLDRLVASHERAGTAFVRASLVILGLIGAEFAVLASVGAVRARAAMGPGFSTVHLALFVLGTPALANVLALRVAPGRSARWLVVAPLCAIFAIALLLMQIHVAEALYGVDNTGGPFGRS